MPRRYSTRKRKFPRRARKFPRRGKFARRRMTKRGLLNITSQKKRDTMMIGRVNSDGSVSPVGRVEYNILPSVSQLFISCASYKERVNNSNEASRTQRNVFLKGIRENVRWESGGPDPVLVRRIVVTGSPRIDLSGGVSGITTQPTKVVLNGVHYIGIGTGEMNFNVNELLFGGTFNVDWNDASTSKIDPRRWKVHSDRRFIVRSGNTSEGIMQRKFYDAINRNITYDDDENGTTMVPSGWASFSSTGHHQNTYIIYQVYNPGTTTVTPSFSIQRTLYWHER